MQEDMAQSAISSKSSIDPQVNYSNATTTTTTTTTKTTSEIKKQSKRRHIHHVMLIIKRNISLNKKSRGYNVFISYDLHIDFLMSVMEIFFAVFASFVVFSLFILFVAASHSLIS